MASDELLWPILGHDEFSLTAAAH